MTAIARFKLKNGFSEKHEVKNFPQSSVEKLEDNGNIPDGLKELHKLYFVPNAKPHFEHTSTIPLLQSTNIEILNRLSNVSDSNSKQNGNTENVRSKKF